MSTEREEMIAQITRRAAAYVDTGPSVTVEGGLLRALQPSMQLKSVWADGHLAVSKAGTFWRLTRRGFGQYNADPVSHRALHDWELREILSRIQATLAVAGQV